MQRIVYYHVHYQNPYRREESSELRSTSRYLDRADAR